MRRALPLGNTRLTLSVAPARGHFKRVGYRAWVDRPWGRAYRTDTGALQPITCGSLAALPSGCTWPGSVCRGPQGECQLRQKVVAS